MGCKKCNCSIKLSDVERRKFYIPVCGDELRNKRCILQGGFGLYMLVTMIISIATKHKNGKWLVYLTRWNFMMCTMYFITAFIVNLKNRKLFVDKGNRQNINLKGKPSTMPTNEQIKSTETKECALKAGSIENENFVEISLEGTRSYDQTAQSAETTSVTGISQTSKVKGRTSSMPSYKTPIEKTTCEEKIYWLLYSICHVVCPIVVIMYWSFLFKGTKFAATSALNQFIDINEHAIVYVLLLIEYVITDIPSRIANFFYPLAFLLIYVIVNVVYWGVTGTVIYSVLNWSEKPGIAVGIIFTIIAISMFLQAAFSVIDLLKDICSSRAECKNTEGSNQREATNA